MTCTVDGCEKPRGSSKLYCSMHIKRVHRYGDPDGHGIRYSRLATPDQRFWDKVNKTATCWLWTASCEMDGYAQFWASGRLWRAHRWAYLRLVGPIPKGLHLDHLCRVRNCVNPEHLEPVTPAENMRRMRAARKEAS